MRVVKELPDTRGKTYLLVQDGNDKRTVRTTCTRHSVNGIDTFVFRDSAMRILMKPSCFITEELRYEARNTAHQAVSAMKALESFCEIIDTPFEAFSTSEARAMTQFLRGTLGEGVSFRFELTSQRSEATVGAYLKHYRRYARWRGVSNSPFLQARDAAPSRHAPIERYGIVPHRIKADIRPRDEAPRYISVPEYRRVLDVIDKSWSIEEKCIVRLMFEHGLRIGEVLGLTIEDLEQSSDRDGKPTYAVILRNRTSDEDFQRAKTLMAITDQRQYKSKDYRKRNVGQQRVYLSYNLFFQLAEYAGESHGDDANLSSCQADSVDGGNGNRYLFLNTKDRPLSSNLWNKRLRRIMRDAGVSVDTDVRKTNLNHRFRHGFAMFLTKQAKVNGQPLDAFTVMTLMRHSSLSSTDVYLQPTQEDIRELQRKVIGSWREELYGTR